MTRIAAMAGRVLEGGATAVGIFQLP